MILIICRVLAIYNGCGTNSLGLTIDKLQLRTQNLGRVFNSIRSCVHDVQFLRYGVKLTNLKLKTRPKQLLGSLLLYFAPWPDPISLLNFNLLYQTTFYFFIKLFLKSEGHPVQMWKGLSYQSRPLC
jgi:hypothetical protein